MTSCNCPLKKRFMDQLPPRKQQQQRCFCCNMRYFLDGVSRVLIVLWWQWWWLNNNNSFSGSWRNDHGSFRAAWFKMTIDSTTTKLVVHAYTPPTRTATGTTIIGYRRRRHRQIQSLQSVRRHDPIFLAVDEYHQRNTNPIDDQLSSTTTTTTTATTTTTNNITTIGIRLNKVFTNVYSRRAADSLIANGRVAVNDEIVTDLGRRVIPYKDIVRLDQTVYLHWEQHVNYNNNNNDYYERPPPLDHPPANNNNNNNTVDSVVVSPRSSTTLSGETNTNNTIHSTTGSNDTNAQQQQHVYIKYWKPVGVISTTDRNIPGNLIDSIYRGSTPTTTTTTRTTTTSRFRPATTTSRQRHDVNDENVRRLQDGRRIFNVGRLDKDSSGLLLLTSDGRIPNIVLSSKQRTATLVHQYAKVYNVVVDRPITYDHLQQLRQGIVITTDTVRQKKHIAVTAKTLPCTIEPLYINHNNKLALGRSPTKKRRIYDQIDDDDNNDIEDDDTQNRGSGGGGGGGGINQYTPTNAIQITLMEGRNRQIRVMLQTIGKYQVRQLHRIQFMSSIDLTNLHQPGDWTYLNSTELASLQLAITTSQQQLVSCAATGD